MNRYVQIRVVLVLAGLFLAGGWKPAAARPEMLPDSTTVEQWTLANGLRVTTRDIPGAPGVAIAVAYGSGTAADPAGHEGLAHLLAEIEFTAAAGDVPDRRRDELTGQRPLGWQVKVLPRATMFVEAATRQQFPGVLHQTVQRIAGVQVTPELVKSALATIRRELRQRYLENPDSIAWFAVRDAAAGADSAALRRLGAGAGLDGLAARDLERMVHERFVPANASLSLAGDLRGIDLHAYLDRTCGVLPAGRAPDSLAIALGHRAVTLRISGLPAPGGVLGVIAPPVTDVVHPEFFLGMLVLGAEARETWGATVPPLSVRFNFSLFDDPDLVRFYPPMSPTRSDTTWVAARGRELIEPLGQVGLDDEALDRIKRGTFWMFGGPMMPDLAIRARRDPAVSFNLSTTMAMRALLEPESFWEQYRRHFGAITTLPMQSMVDYALDPQRQVWLVMLGAASR